MGIDGASHAGAIDGKGSTLAVLGSGPDVIYPAQHRRLAESVAACGALVSEYPPGTEPHRHHFPCRNRIIAGLTLGTLVVEATRRSGSLITARLAGDYGREVFAIPGSIHNPMARGCHQLIRQGAKLMEDSADVLKELAPQLAAYLEPTAVTQAPHREPAEALQSLDASYRKLLDLMGFDPVNLAELTKRSGLTAAELSSMLLVLELESFVEALPGGRFSRIEKRDG
jgi:DNA processing protein